MLSPLVSYALAYSLEHTIGYRVGYEILLFNGLFTFVSLWITHDRRGKEVYV